MHCLLISLNLCFVNIDASLVTYYKQINGKLTRTLIRITRFKSDYGKL